MHGLVDTGILIDILRNHHPAVQWLEENQSLELGCAPTVWMELVAGARDKKSQEQAIQLLFRFELVYPPQEDVDWAMQQLRKLTLSHGVGINDCLIAAPAYRLQLPLYTVNLKHFAPLLGALAQQPY